MHRLRAPIRASSQQLKAAMGSITNRGRLAHPAACQQWRATSSDAGSASSASADFLPALLADVLERASVTASEAQAEAVCVRGWVRSVRKMKKVSFAALTDGSTTRPLQIVLTPEQGKTVTGGCSLEVKGQLVPSTAKGQTVELVAEDVKVVGACNTAEFPILKAKMTPEHLREHPHMRARTRQFSALLRIRSTLTHHTHSYFDRRRFVHVNTPVLTSSDCEGAGEVFRALAPSDTLDQASTQQQSAPSADTLSQETSRSHAFFAQPMFLSVSGQLHLEAAMMGLSRVYVLGPTFRAENSNTARHLAEFYMLEAEIAHATLDDTMALIEDYVRNMATEIQKACADDLALLHESSAVDTQALVQLTRNSPYPKMDYSEAVRLLEKSTHSFEVEPRWGMDLTSQHEQWLAQQCEGPVFVYNYPAAIKPFYMRPVSTDYGDCVEAVDLIVPRIGELVGGSVREERPDVLQRRTGRRHEILITCRASCYLAVQGFILGLQS